MHPHRTFHKKPKMHHPNKSRIVLIIFGLILFIVALPTTWLSVRNPKIFTPLPEGMRQAYANQTIEIDGISGAMSFLSLPNVPIWLVAASGLLSGLILFLNSKRILAVPRLLVLLPLLFTALFSFGALYSSLDSQDVTIGSGAIASMVGVSILAYVTLAKEKRRRTSLLAGRYN